MTDEQSTRAVELEAGDELSKVAPQTWAQVWHTRFLTPVNPPPAADSPAANRNGMPTSGAQKIEVPDRRPKRTPAKTFGRRGLLPLYQWEGVVEEVSDSGFTARLVPIEDGSPVREKAEFTDFAFEDLSDPSDVDLVSPGAVFYWTVGRGKNEAGTISNTSLVRLRRLPLPGIYQHMRARAEAEELMRGFGAEPSS
jgi:hypothetical protein